MVLGEVSALPKNTTGRPTQVSNPNFSTLRVKHKYPLNSVAHETLKGNKAKQGHFPLILPPSFQINT